MSLLHTCLAGLLLFLPTLPAAQNLSAGEAEPSPGFRIPAADLAAIVELPRSPQVEISPDGRLLLELTRAGAEALEDLARPERPLAGMRLDARRPGPSRVSGYPGFRLLHADTGEALPAPELPEGARIGHVSWSPDGRFLALALVDAEHWRLAVIELDGERARYSALPAMPDLNAVFGNPLAWLPEGRGLVFRAVPDQGVLPETRAGLAPRILQTDGRKAPGRTWADLLRTDEDEREFGHLATSRLWVVEHEGRDWQARALAAPPALYTSQQPSPDGRWLLVEELRPPFSRTRPWYDFPTRISVLHADGRPATVLADRPLADQVPISHGSPVSRAPGTRNGARTRTATLAWIEALDGGDADRPAELRDELVLLARPLRRGARRDAPHGGPAFRRVSWHGPDLALVYSRWWPERRHAGASASGPASPPGTPPGCCRNATGRTATAIRASP
jgi:dipeptidyl aminopeptidase/acylaminoacyl peptidase